MFAMRFKKVHKELSLLLILREQMGINSLRGMLIYADDNYPRLKNEGEQIFGLINIAHALGYKGSKEAKIKRAQRTIKKFSLQCTKQGNKIAASRYDIELFKQQSLVGKKTIADFLEISTKTLSRWLKSKRYAKIPIRREKMLYANRNALRRWNIMRVARNIGLQL
jgi:DNA-binding transcriptional regulator YiaG